MMFLDSFYDFIRGLDRRDMWRWGSLYVGICVVGMTIIMIRHVMVSDQIRQKMVQLNKARGTVQQILTKFQVVQEQKTKVDEALKQNKGFNIQKFVADLLGQQSLTSQVTSRFAHQKLPNGYIEESLVLTCTQLTTQQLCELILAIEQQSLMYINFVDITRMMHAKKINVSISIATLQAEE
jgi:hypothetical protein